MSRRILAVPALVLLSTGLGACSSSQDTLAPATGAASSAVTARRGADDPIVVPADDKGGQRAGGKGQGADDPQPHARRGADDNAAAAGADDKGGQRAGGKGRGADDPQPHA